MDPGLLSPTEPAAVGGDRHGFVSGTRSVGSSEGRVRSMAEQVSVTREFVVPADVVWAMVSDVTRMGEWSPENESCEWLAGATGPRPGAKFRGVNRIGKKTWKTVSTIVDAEPGRLFSFRVAAMGLRVAEWRYSFEPTAAGCRVTETWTDHRNALLKRLSRPVTGVADRAVHNRAGMDTTLERLAEAAESAASR